MPVSKKSHPDWVQLAIRLLQWGICILMLGEFLDSFRLKFSAKCIQRVLSPLFCVHGIDLVGCDHLGPCQKFRIIGLKLI